jgi:hypothetical protein
MSLPLLYPFSHLCTLPLLYSSLFPPPFYHLHLPSWSPSLQFLPPDSIPLLLLLLPALSLPTPPSFYSSHFFKFLSAMHPILAFTASSFSSSCFLPPPSQSFPIFILLIPSSSALLLPFSFHSSSFSFLLFTPSFFPTRSCPFIPPPPFFSPPLSYPPLTPFFPLFLPSPSIALHLLPSFQLVSVLYL